MEFSVSHRFLKHSFLPQYRQFTARIQFSPYVLLPVALQRGKEHLISTTLSRLPTHSKIPRALENNGSPSMTTAQGGRTGEVKRVTKETNVYVMINLDGNAVAENNTGIPFLDHMLDALLQSLGDRKGINRFGDFSAPLDESLLHVSLDLSGRPHLGYDLHIPTERVGTYDAQLVEHFFQSLVNTSGMTLHIRQLAGSNSHHIIEATFKAFARALRQATEYDPRRPASVPSSKGVLSRT